MKHRKTVLSLLLTAALLLGSAAAVGGGADDPLISLDYLQTVFAPKAESAAQERLDASGQAAYAAQEARWRAAVASVDAAGGGDTAAAESVGVWTEARLKRGDTLTGVTGTQVSVLAGDVAVRIYSGAAVDATDGVELRSGASLPLRHRCLAAEDAAVEFVVTSRTAVLNYCGGYHFTASTAEPDYNAIASALKSLSLFRGTDTGYGDGFDLERTPTRLQALVMLIRMLGEEDAALACTSPSPFKDIANNHWGRAYVAYAFEKGYTNGVEDNKFAPDRAASADMYVEFVLRALGYSSTAQTDISDAADRAMAVGVITSGEREALLANDFLRADVAYLSWYALGAPLPGTLQTLHEKLEAAGTFTASAYESALARVRSPRL
ncbi:MAG: S-layer homology domain-containing protein [Ruminococcaceae bacterium]|nr:S-layer homology domain-containing protein [Oscillospiraceae bacterium]